MDLVSFLYHNAIVLNSGTKMKEGCPKVRDNLEISRDYSKILAFAPLMVLYCNDLHPAVMDEPVKEIHRLRL